MHDAAPRSTVYGRKSAPRIKESSPRCDRAPSLPSSERFMATFSTWLTASKFGCRWTPLPVVARRQRVTIRIPISVEDLDSGATGEAVGHVDCFVYCWVRLMFGADGTRQIRNWSEVESSDTRRGAFSPAAVSLFLHLILPQSGWTKSSVHPVRCTY